MKNKLNDQEKKLYRQTDEVLHYMWDPIGVKGIAQARDEYHSYLPHVFSLLLKGENTKQITETLLGIKEAIIDDGF